MGQFVSTSQYPAVKGSMPGAAVSEQIPTKEHTVLNMWLEYYPSKLTCQQRSQVTPTTSAYSHHVVCIDA